MSRVFEGTTLSSEDIECVDYILHHDVFNSSRVDTAWVFTDAEVKDKLIAITESKSNTYNFEKLNDTFNHFIGDKRLSWNEVAE